jgi:hypothetical protein
MISTHIEFLKKLNKNLPEFVEKFKSINKTKQSENIISNKDYPFGLYEQRLGSTKDEILETLEKESILPFSIPFIQYNPTDENFYLLYHTIDYEKLIKSYSNKLVSDIAKDYTFKFKDGNTYVGTILSKRHEFKELLKNIIENENQANIKVANLGNYRKKEKLNFLEYIKELSKKGFSIIPLFLKSDFIENPHIVVIPSELVYFPNLFSIEHEIDVRNRNIAKELFNNYILDSEPISVLKDGERSYKDTSLNPRFGYEFVVGGHLFTNLINKSNKLFDILEENGLLLPYAKDYEKWKNGYGMHISVSIPQLIDTKVLYNYLHNIGILYDLLTRHKNRLGENCCLNLNSFQAFINGERGIFRFIENKNVTNKTIQLNPRKITSIFRKVPQFVFKELILDKIIENDNTLKIISTKFVKNSKNPIDDIFDQLTTIYNVINKLSKISENKILIHQELSDPVFKPQNLDKVLEFLSQNNSLKQLIETLKKIKENNLSTEIEKLKDILSKNKTSLETIKETLKNSFHNLYSSKLLALYYHSKTKQNEWKTDYPISEIQKIKKELEELKKSKYSKGLSKFINELANELELSSSKISSVVMNRLEIRFPQSGYSLDYISNNLIFVYKMIKDLLFLNDMKNIEDESKMLSTSNWSIYNDEQIKIRNRIKENDELRNFILRDVLGFKDNEIKLFEHYFKKYC